MQFREIVTLLNDDLKNEWKHLQFYLHHASAITGLHAHEYKEFLLEQAASEMQHVSQFSDMIIGLGGVATTDSHDFPKLTTAGAAFGYAAFMEAGRGDWVTKIGADGVQVIGSKSRGEALAIKISDGNKTALYAAAVETLDQLGWLDDAQRALLAPWRASDILSARGATVGQRRPALQLQAA
jgi:rubrerythrin